MYTSTSKCKCLTQGTTDIALTQMHQCNGKDTISSKIVNEFYMFHFGDKLPLFQSNFLTNYIIYIL